jgi:hypothetical protein
MKRSLAALALLLAPLAACAGGGYGYGDPTPVPSGSYRGTGPLYVRIGEAAGSSFRLETNDDAFVAVFEVVPGGGVQLLYPRYRSEAAYLRAGQNRVDLTSSGDRFGRVGQARRYGTYLLAVASRNRMSLNDIRWSAGMSQRSLGYGTALVSTNPRAQVREILDALLPPQGEDDWATDLLEVRPSLLDGGYAYGSGYGYDGYGGYGGYGNYGGAYGYVGEDPFVEVRCGDGSVRATRLSRLQSACNNHGGTGEGPTVPRRPRAPHTDDSTTAVVPTRVRPQPATGDPQDPGTGRVLPGAVTRGDDGDVRADAPRRRPIDIRRVEPADAPPAPRDEPRRAQPADDSPRRRGWEETRSQEPARTPEPRREEPRREEPRREEPRVETRREEPRVEPRAEPQRAPESPRAEPARSPEPARTPPPSRTRP